MLKTNCVICDQTLVAIVECAEKTTLPNGIQETVLSIFQRSMPYSAGFNEVLREIKCIRCQLLYSIIDDGWS